MTKTKRSTSVTRTLKTLAASGIAARAVLPDGTVIEVLSNSTATPTEVTVADTEADEADRAFDVAFGKGIQEPK